MTVQINVKIYMSEQRPWDFPPRLPSIITYQLLYELIACESFSQTASKVLCPVSPYMFSTWSRGAQSQENWRIHPAAGYLDRVLQAVKKHGPSHSPQQGKWAGVGTTEGLWYNYQKPQLDLVQLVQQNNITSCCKVLHWTIMYTQTHHVLGSGIQ